MILCVSVLAASCSWLDNPSPKGQIPANKLTDNDLALLTNGTLHQYEAFLSNLWFEGDYLAENFKGGPGFSYADVHGETQSASAQIPLTRWQYCYQKLNYANLLIKSALAASNQDNEDVKTALGTGYLFRAMIYTGLVQRYGGVPIIKVSGSTEIVPRSSEEDVWSMIVEDLKAAEGLLGEFNSFAYPSKEFCKAFRAKIMLWMAQDAEAIALADDVIKSGRFSLNSNSTDFASMFINGTSNKEIIFAPINIRSTDYIRLFERVNDTDGSYNYSPTDECWASLYSDDATRTGDIRKAATFSAEDPKPIIKFPNGQGGQFVKNPDPSQSPLMCMRLADVYLIKAEAQWASGDYPGARETILTLLEERYASVNLPASLGKDELEALILDENRREFYSEGHRWFDIKRIGLRHHSADFAKWIDTQYSEWNGRDFLMYWPIPQDERDKAGGAYTQNPGYSGAEQ